MRPWIVLAVALLLGLATPAQAAELLTIEEFTNKVAQRMVFKKPDIQVTVELPSTIVVSSEEGELSRTYSDNTYAMYRENAADEATIIENFALFAIANLEQSETVSISRVLPVVRSWSWLLEITAGMDVKSGKVWDGVVYAQGLSDELMLTFVEDSEQGLAYLKTSRVLEAFGTAAEAKRISYRNFRRLLNLVTFEKEKGLTRVVLDGTYESSLILFDEVWSDKRLSVTGDVVVAIPSRGDLLVAGSNDPGGLAELKAIAVSIGLEHPYRISTRLFVRRAGKWVRFDQ